MYICVLISVLTCGRRQTKKDDRCALIRVLIYVCSCGCLYVVAAEAQQRLDALEEFGVLGSGCQVQMLDGVACCLMKADTVWKDMSGVERE